MLDNAILSMEPYAATEAGLYLIPKVWKKKGSFLGGGEHKPKERWHRKETR